VGCKAQWGSIALIIKDMKRGTREEVNARRDPENAATLFCEVSHFPLTAVYFITCNFNSVATG
jgi:hypothetical protein